jgi:hypothetical protein
MAGWWARPRRLLALIVVLLCLLSQQSVGLAGDTIGPGGDCWRAGTPVNCRVGWQGTNSFFVVSLVDEMNNATYHSLADTARNNWSNASGPQQFQWVASPIHPTWVRLRVNVGYYCACATTNNFNSSGTDISDSGGFINYSLIQISPAYANPADANLGINAFGHELGHTLGLAHHPNEMRGLMWPYNNSTYLAPTEFDIGLNPPCGLSISYLGVRCIYNFGLGG